MSSEESGSLADQAAAWVPPWARPSAPASSEGTVGSDEQGSGDDAKAPDDAEVPDGAAETPDEPVRVSDETTEVPDGTVEVSDGTVEVSDEVAEASDDAVEMLDRAVEADPAETVDEPVVEVPVADGSDGTAVEAADGELVGEALVTDEPAEEGPDPDDAVAVEETAGEELAPADDEAGVEEPVVLPPPLDIDAADEAPPDEPTTATEPVAVEPPVADEPPADPDSHVAPDSHVDPGSSADPDSPADSGDSTGDGPQSAPVADSVADQPVEVDLEGAVQPDPVGVAPQEDSGTRVPVGVKGKKAAAEELPPDGDAADAAVPLLSEAELQGAVEAILLVVDEPTTEIIMAQILEQPTERITGMLEKLVRDYTDSGRGFELRRVAGGWRLYTRPEYASYVEKFVLDGQQVRLTQAALETLAVIAYKQPVSRSRISAIRGVNCDGVVRTLVARGLIEECGSEPESGAFLYRTTTLFLEKLGLDGVDQLPPLAPFLPDDIDEIADAQS